LLGRLQRSGLELKMNRFHGIAGAAVLAALLSGARQARADIAIAGDVDVGLPVGQRPPQNYLATGAGFDLRFGYRFRIPYQPLFVIPEIAAGYTDLDAGVIRVRPGLRVSFGRLVIPFAYAHLGWGWASFDPLGVSDPRTTTPDVSAGGLSFDAGGGVDFAVLRRVMVGVHLGYNVIDVGQAATTTPDWRAKWINVGLGATVLF
jgi:hypothetical protein